MIANRYRFKKLNIQSSWFQGTQRKKIVISVNIYWELTLCNEGPMVRAMIKAWLLSQNSSNYSKEVRYNIVIAQGRIK